MSDRIEAWVRKVLRLPPAPSEDPVLTPFAQHAREVRREAIEEERKRQRDNQIEAIYLASLRRREGESHG